MALVDFQQMVDDLVRDQSRTIVPAVRDRAIDQAVLRYSADRPRGLVLDTGWLVSGYVGPLPEGWTDDCLIRDAEYPIGNHPRSLIGVSLYQNDGGALLMSDVELPAGVTVRLTLAAAHRLAGAEDTIPTAHRLAVASHAAWQLCTQLATYYSGQRETLVNADHSNTESRARDYAARAKEYRSAYFIGTDQVDPYAKSASGNGNTSAASAVVSWPGRPRNRLTRGLQ